VADFAIELDAVTKKFGDSQALRGVTFSTPVGSVLGVLGPNGAGKTTTINILSTLIQPSSIAITAVGIAMGLRFHEGWVAAIGFVLMPVLMVIGFSTAIIAFGVQAAGKNIITGPSTVCFLLLFFNSGMVPIDVFPGWLQPVVRAQPMSPAIEAMRGLADGGPTLRPVLQSVAWVVGLVAVFGPIAVRGYRVAAESGT
jgi:daunorubicin resistance protein C